MPFPDEYWTRYQRPITTLVDYVELMQRLGRTWPDRRFVWRGVHDASYSLHSSLYRHVVQLHGGAPAEAVLRRVEAEIVGEARLWGLQRTSVDRLSAMELLASLQHQGVPTRLIDFTHNPLVGLWFAIEQRLDDNGAALPDRDGRVFVAQADVRQISPPWERSPDVPWSANPPADWLSDIYVWTPPPLDPRMIRQQGCFVFGGVPTTTGGWNLPGPPRARMLQTTEVRECVSVPIRMNNPAYIDQRLARGRPPRYALAFTFLIPATAKEELRRDLEAGFGYTHAMMYPDYAGFAKYGRAWR